MKINGLIAAKRLNQIAAAARLQVGQPRISALKNYRLDGFSFERLISFLLALGQDPQSELEQPIGVITPVSELRAGAWKKHRDKGTEVGPIAPV
jgi:hypothetical protein